MPVRKMTPQETREWLGNGLVIFGQKPPSSFEKSSTQSSPQPNNKPETEQDEHDQRMAQQTPEEYSAMIKGLAALARSKLMNEPSSSSSETPESLPSNEPLPPA